MNPEEIIAKDIESFLREHLPTLNVYAERLARSRDLGPHAGRELLSELYPVLKKKWATELVLADVEARLAFSRRVISILAKRLVASKIKDRARYAPLPEGADHGWLPAHLHDVDAADHVIAQELVTDLHNCLELLSSEERDVVTLRFLDDVQRTNRQIAEDLGLPERKVSRLFNSALNKIRPHMLAMSYEATDHRGGNR